MRFDFFILGMSASSSLKITLDQCEHQAAPSNPQGVPRKDIGQIVPGSENPAKANKGNDQEGDGNHEAFPKGRRYLRDQ
jgi:hypothetical protein